MKTQVYAKAYGHTMAEFGLILALVVLISFPALAVLGDVLNEHYSRNHFAGAKGLFSLLTPSAGGASVDALSRYETYAGDLSDPMLGERYEAVKVNFDTPDGVVMQFITGASSAAEATSAEGNRYLANQIRLMAETGQTPSGQPIPDQLRPQLLRLANAGFTIADNQHELYKDPSREWGHLNHMQGAMFDFSNLYRVVDKEFESVQYLNDPAIRELDAIIAQYSGVISSSARYSADYFLTEMNNPTYQLNGDIDNTVVGQPPADNAVITIDNAHVLTDQASQGIHDEAEKRP